MSSLEQLKRLINVEDITAITTKEATLSIPETLELMSDVNVESLNSDLTFWTKKEKIIVYVYEDKYDEWNSEVQLMKVNLTPSKGLIKGVPESVTNVWEDPESGKSLPFKTDAYYHKQIELEKIKFERAKAAEEKAVEELNAKNKKDENYFNSLKTVEEEPFTIIKGGRNNNCRYVIVPKDYPYSRSTYGLLNDFYNKVSPESRAVIDFSGIAANKNGKLEIAARYLPLNVEEHYTKERRLATIKHNELYDKLEENSKFVKVIGFSIESLNYNELGTLDEVAEKLRDELKALSEV